ncbi:MAG TPA: tRNA 2-thiouridine(34) synthase MnmA [Solirubrobacteraceae bacterium]|jgi:tRNA-specific 2-thiouridylase|nr:tRNA 2-thiouridine(34) synthase MnmA [Solirubrobacteraceae bacterium]
MDALAFEHHLTSPQGRGHRPPHGHCATVGGYACGDEITMTIAVDGDRIADAGFQARGCGASTAAASAAITLARGAPILEAARLGAHDVARELGGLSPGKFHAAELAADALARALGSAVRARAHIPRDPLNPATLVAMSGGVDSAVAAHLCAQTGRTLAVTLELWADAENDAERSCCSATAVAQARSLAHQMGIPHFTIDLREEFRAGVVDPFIAGYAAGETPNPCVGCNGHVRLDAMLELADRLGCATLATGHYARTAESDDARGPLLRAAIDQAKDQTYMLAALKPQSLARMRFPLGELRKPEVREIAARAGLPVAAKVDSQDLCFLAGTSRARFMERHGGIEGRPGEIVDSRGAVLGRHDGQHRFTVGQRRGIGIHATEPLFVLHKDSQDGRVTVGTREELRTDRVAVRAARLHRCGSRVNNVKLRYRQRPLTASVTGDPGEGRHRSLSLELAEPFDGAAPGQLACLMDGDLVVGWGTIDAPGGRGHT